MSVFDDVGAEAKRPAEIESAQAQLAEAQAERMALLERRLSRPPGVGVWPPVATVALCGALFLLWSSRADIAYLLSSTEPISLGAEGAYRFDLAQSNRYAEIHGEPTSRGAFFVERGIASVVIGVAETPLLVARKTLPNEAFEPGQKPPRPDARSFAVRGRLLSEADASKYESAFRLHAQLGEVSPKWILIADSKPGTDQSVWAWTGGLVFFALLNAWLLVRGLRARRIGRASV
jgi:hypothetical protein